MRLVNNPLADDKADRYLALAEGLLVTLIAGSTLVFVKMAFDYLGPLTISGLRYSLASLLLLPLMLHRGAVRRWPAQLWIRFLVIGVSFCVIGNGALYWGLKYIPATTGSLLLNLVPLLVVFGGMLWLQEAPARWQVGGILVGLAGSALFFAPGLEAGEPLGIAIVSIGLAGVAAYGILGREIARERRVNTLSLTAIPLAFGGSILLLLAFVIEGFPEFSVAGWVLVLWLAIINTACVYALYNHALRTLAAFEMSVILSLTPLVTAFWAWLLLGEKLATIQLIGIVIVILGVALVQWGGQIPDSIAGRTRS